MYLGSSEYRIHGTNDPTTIGKFVSSGCIRLTNEDVTDLFSRVNVGTKVVVLPKNATHLEAQRTIRNDFRNDWRGSTSHGAGTTGGNATTFGPTGDEPFDVVALLKTEPLIRRRPWSGDQARLALGAAAAWIALTVPPAAQAEDFLSALFGAFGGGRPQAPMIPLPFANESDDPGGPETLPPTPARRLFRRLSGLLRAHLRRTLFPDLGTGQ